MLALLLPLFALAADTTPLFEARQKELAGVPFFCPIGRAPLPSTVEALAVRPSPACRFNGPLDSVREPLRLEPPFLDPGFSLEKLRALVPVDTGGRFTLDGEGFRAEMLPSSQLKDTLFHLHIYPARWGDQFLSIVADRPSGVDAFARILPGAFWKNPHFAEEQSVLPLLQRSGREHTALPLLSKCGELGALPRLLLVGDMHRPEDSAYFENVVATHDFAFAALEVSRDKQPSLDAFLAADAASEGRFLDEITEDYPKDVIGPFQSMLRRLKTRRIPIVFMDRQQSYFNFPYTDLAFHGLPIAARNLLWASRLPDSWVGSGALFGGRDHFLDLPGADFQDFARTRFPGLEMKLINPLEKCN